MRIDITALEEDETPEQSERRTGSASGYAKAIREMMEKADGLWGWCTVRVRVRYKGHVGEAYLGNCSYSNEMDFIENSGYFTCMVSEARQEAIEQVAERRLSGL